MPTSSLAEKGLKISKNALFNVFIGRATKLLGKPFKVVTILNETADKLASKDSTDNKFKQLFDVGLTLVRLVRAFISGEYRDISTNTVISGLAVLLYVLSPVDLVPDFIPVIGFLDDLSLIGWFVGKFQGEILKFREWEQTGARTAVAGTGPDAAAEPARGDQTLPSVAELGHS
ncbi:YkvA family protein [Hymenobacter terrigena]